MPCQLWAYPLLSPGDWLGGGRARESCGGGAGPEGSCGGGARRVRWLVELVGRSAFPHSQCGLTAWCRAPNGNEGNHAATSPRPASPRLLSPRIAGWGGSRCAVGKGRGRREGRGGVEKESREGVAAAARNVPVGCCFTGPHMASSYL